MSERPAATRNSELAAASPFRNWSRTAVPVTAAVLVFFSQEADFLVGRLELRAGGVVPVHHHALAAFLRELADVGAHRRLVVDRPPCDRPEGRRHLEAFQRLDELLGV